ncbi:MAG: transposase, partial [Treponema sp.]|nr:transposase [Treponema sp.]
MGWDILDLSRDYLLVSTRRVTATGLSELADGAISHDRITRFLAGEELNGKGLWLKAKKLTRQYGDGEGCLIFDDTIVEKAYMDEDEIICWYYDHSKGRDAKGIHILTAFYVAENEYGKLRQTPIDYQITTKTKTETDEKSGKERRASERSKNELISRRIQKHVKFGSVLADSWFASAENMRFIGKKGKAFIFEINDNRLAAVNEREREKGRFVRVDRMEIPDEEPVLVYLKGLTFPAMLYKQVFKNKDGSTGLRYLAANDETMGGDRFKTLYKKRWGVEVYHESIKQNTAIGKSPARTERTQSNHVFAAIYAYVKLEL